MMNPGDGLDQKGDLIIELRLEDISMSEFGRQDGITNMSDQQMLQALDTITFEPEDGEPVDLTAIMKLGGL